MKDRSPRPEAGRPGQYLAQEQPTRAAAKSGKRRSGRRKAKPEPIVVFVPEPEPARRHRPWGRYSLVFLAVLLALAAVPPMRRAAAVAASRAVLVVASPLTPGVPDLSKLPQPSKVLAADGSLLATLSDRSRAVVSLRALPEHVGHAVLAAEDQHFYQHSGVDPEAALRAVVSTARGRTQGGSTITQQLAKINYTAGERTVLRKLREVLYATRLEQRYTKEQLLERYLNQVYFGDGAYGIDAAAEAYFGIHAAKLSPAQAALLAGKIRAPEILDPRQRPEAVIHRRDQVLDSMAARGWLPRADAARAKAEDLVLVPRQPPGVVKAPHFVEYVKREARGLEELGPDIRTRLNRLFSGGYSIRTTLEPKVFDATEAAVRKRLGQPGDPLTAVASVVPGDGAIRTLFGGLDFAAMQFDLSSQGARQPGSAFKPFVYLAALRQRIDPRTTFDGTSGRRIPCYGNRPVNNDAGEDAGGRIDVDTALAQSVNVVFVELGCQVGVRSVVNASTDAGIPDDATDAQGAVFLGGLDRGVSPLQMAAAYATFTAGGVYAAPYSIDSVRNAEGDVVYEHERRTRHVFEAPQVEVLNRALQGVVSRGTGRAARLGRPVAGKTGTTQDNVDAWFIGYVPQLSTAVWVGYEPRAPMNNVHGRTVTGGAFPAAIFSDLMRQALKGVPAKDIPTASPEDLGLSRLDPAATATTAAVPDSTTTPPEPATTSPDPS